MSQLLASCIAIAMESSLRRCAPAQAVCLCADQHPGMSACVSARSFLLLQRGCNTVQCHIPKSFKRAMAHPQSCLSEAGALLWLCRQV